MKIKVLNSPTLELPIKLFCTLSRCQSNCFCDGHLSDSCDVDLIDSVDVDVVVSANHRTLVNPRDASKHGETLARL